MAIRVHRYSKEGRLRCAEKRCAEKTTGECPRRSPLPSLDVSLSFLNRCKILTRLLTIFG